MRNSKDAKNRVGTIGVYGYQSNSNVMNHKALMDMGLVYQNNNNLSHIQQLTRIMSGSLASSGVHKPLIK
jgi:predicted RNA-binding protein with PUA-like domain